MTARAPRFSVVVLTHNRRAELLRTLAQLESLEERPFVCVVDNASRDGTAQAITARHPGVHLVTLLQNAGAAGRNHGVAACRTPYVAFCDDDTWWAKGALEHAAAILDAHPRLAAVTARVLVGPDESEDPSSVRMAVSPLENRLGVPGTAVLGVMAGACMMRRTAFTAVGGYQPRFFIGAEEALLAIDLMAAGWDMAYVPDAVVHHYPSGARDAAARRRLLLRNALWCAWLRRPVRSALRETASLVGKAWQQPTGVGGALDALRGLPWLLQERRVVPPHVEQALQTIARFYA
jgi:GT2 family glycosyltransferase